MWTGGEGAALQWQVKHRWLGGTVPGVTQIKTSSAPQACWHPKHTQIITGCSSDRLWTLRPDCGKRWRGVWKRWLLVGSDRCRNTAAPKYTHWSSPSPAPTCLVGQLVRQLFVDASFGSPFPADSTRLTSMAPDWVPPRLHTPHNF